MKQKFTILGSLLFIITISFAFTFSTPNEKYFEGKWDVLIKDIPQGDVTIPMRFESTDGETIGFFQEPGTQEESKMTSVVIEGELLTTSFYISGYDVTLTLRKVDEDHSKGEMMGMFDVEGTRVKAEEK